MTWKVALTIIFLASAFVLVVAMLQSGPLPEVYAPVLR